MKKILILLNLSFLFSYGQAPQKINYQGQVRDALGIPVTTLSSVGVQFVISDNSGVVHNEIQTTVPVNNIGLFNTQIGLVTAISNTITWEKSPYTLSVSIDNGAGFQFLGSQELVSVPFALYAKSSGNNASLPTGTVTGQTLYWDQTNSTWKPNNNLFNNGLNVSVGSFTTNLFQNKLQVHTLNPLDTSAILGYKQNANARDAGVRGFAVGSTPSNTNIGQNAIIGGDFYGMNGTEGAGVGVAGFGTSTGYAYGVVGLARPSAASAIAVGVYGGIQNGSLTPNSYAGFFDGNTYIRDSLFFGPTANPGLAGWVLTRNSTGRARWAPPGAGSSPWIQNAGFVNLSNNNDRVGIGTGTNVPVAKLEISSGGAMDALRINDGGTTNALMISKSSNAGAGLNISMNSGNTGSGLNINQMGIGQGIMVSALSNNGINASTSSSVAANAAINAANTGNGDGITSITSSTNSSSSAILANNTGGGYGVTSYANGSGPSVAGSNTGTGSGVFGQTNSTNGLVAGVQALNNGGGHAMLAISNHSSASTAIGVKAVSNSSSSLAAAVKAEAVGGPSIWGLKTVTAPNGHAGLFENQNTSNGDAVVKVVNSSTVSTSPALSLFSNSNLAPVALLINNGHIASTFGTPTTLTCTLCSWVSPANVTFSGSRNDIRGKVLVNFPSSTINSGNSIDINVQFVKSYSGSQAITVTPIFLNFTYYIISVSPTNFTVRFVYNNATPLVGVTNFEFNYIVID